MSRLQVSTYRKLAWPALFLAVVGMLLTFTSLGYGVGGGWLHAKLVVVLVLAGYHHGCGRLLRRFEAGRNHRSHRWFRVFNEAPVLLLVVAVILVVLKPF